MLPQGKIQRKTKETDIKLEIILSSTESSNIKSGVPFFDHMLNSMAKHGRMSINLTCKGDYEIDDHHSIEDIGICMGQAFKQALGNKIGIFRFGEATIPMDDALCSTTVDLSGRYYFNYTGLSLDGEINRYREELTLEFLRSFAVNSSINLHVNLLYGENRHHIHEAIFKSLGISLFRAYSKDETLDGVLPSTKGIL